MKALILKQACATLIVKGIKKYEFSPWKTNYREKILMNLEIDKKKLRKS